MSQDINRLLERCQKIQSILYTTDYADFQNFTAMENFLEAADKNLTQKIQELQNRKNFIQDQFITASSVYEINNKKRRKQQELLRIQKNRIEKDLNAQKNRLNIQIHPMTMTLRQKRNQLQNLQQTKQIINDFNKLIKGSPQQINQMMPLDQKGFKNSALKIYVFKTILQDSFLEQYAQAKMKINKKYSDLKTRIILNFKEGFIKNDKRLLLSSLPYCEEYDLLQQVSDFYNEQAFKQVHKIKKVSENDGQAQIKNFFFLLQRGFSYAFNEIIPDSGQLNIYQLNSIFNKYSQNVSRRLVTYAFDQIIKQSIDNTLRSTFNSNTYLNCLQTFYKQNKILIKESQKFIKDDKIIHLMYTYFESIFDIYLESYLSKQLNNLTTVYDQCIEQIIKQIKMTQFNKDIIVNPINNNNKFTIKKLFTDYKLQQKRYLIGQQLQAKIQVIIKTFMNPSMEKTFQTTKKSLQRNNKIARINQVDHNRNQILNIFIQQLGDLIQNLIKSIAQLIPEFDSKQPLHPDFFQILPHITMLLQRLQFFYQQYKKQAKYQFSETIKLQQKKQALLYNCQKQINKIISQALCCILASQNNLLKSDSTIYYNPVGKNQTISDVCMKVVNFMEKYLKVINKITLTKYRISILKSLGNQFMNLLVNHYSTISYGPNGLTVLFADIANYKRLVTLINSQQVENRYKCLRSLIDIYVIKNDEKAINNYIKQEKQTNLKGQKQQTLKLYITNKQKNQRQ